MSLLGVVIASVGVLGSRKTSKVMLDRTSCLKLGKSTQLNIGSSYFVTRFYKTPPPSTFSVIRGHS